MITLHSTPYFYKDKVFFPGDKPKEKKKEKRIVLPPAARAISMNTSKSSAKTADAISKRTLLIKVYKLPLSNYGCGFLMQKCFNLARNTDRRWAQGWAFV